jgi:ligand-binding sensor domain-containing protein
MRGRLVLCLFVILFYTSGCHPKKSIDHQNDLQQAVIIQPSTSSDVYITPSTKLLAAMPSTPTRRYTSSVKTTTTTNSSQSKPFREGHALFTTYTADDGLALSSVCSSILDAKGNLWFGTQGGGVSKFNGKEFINYTPIHGLSNNTVLSILEDKHGNIWFGTDGGGVSMYDGKLFTTITEADGLCGNTIRCIIEDKFGYIWFGAQGGGISKLVNDDWAQDSSLRRGVFLNYGIREGMPNDEIYSMSFDTFGNLWIGTFRAGLLFLPANQAQRNEKQIALGTSYFSTLQTTNGLPSNRVLSLLIDKKNTLWVGTDKGIALLPPFQTKNEIVEYQKSNNSFTQFSVKTGLPNDAIRCINEDDMGAIWVGTDGGGVCKINTSSDKIFFTNYSTLNGLPNDVIYTITNDHLGNMWIGTIGGGVSKYYGNTFSHFTTNQGLAGNIVWTIEEDQKGNLWFGTDDGGISNLKTIHEKENSERLFQFEKFGKAQGLSDESILSIEQDKQGNLWCGTYGNGVDKITFKENTYTVKNYSKNQGLANTSVLSILQDTLGDIWFATVEGGLSRYSNQHGIETITNYTTQQGLPSNSINFLFQDHLGNLWIGTQLHGISKLSISNRKKGRITFQNFSTKQGLSSNAVYCISEGHYGEIYVGTENGLNSLLPIKNNQYQLFLYTTANKLPDDFITNVIQLPDGKIAVGTNKGIAICKPTLFNPRQIVLQEIEIFNSTTGYPIKDINGGHHAMLLDKNKILWAGTGYDKIGLIQLDYSRLTKNKSPLYVAIDKIKLNEQNIAWYSTNGFNAESKEDSLKMAHEQLLLFGKQFLKKEASNYRKTYANIQFNGVEKFFSVPEQLVLPYAHNNITICFHAVHVARYPMIQYQYMLEGYDKEWSPLLKKTEVNYGNINEGQYTFKVKALSPDGVWSTPTLYTFEVTPPWFRTWWAYVIYFLCSVTAISFFIKWRLKDFKERQELLEATVKERTIELMNEKKIVEQQREETEKVIQTI